MGMARSTFYDRPERPADDTAIVEAMFAICDDFGFYGYRRVGAALRHQGLVVNHKKIRRLMREYGLQPRRPKRFAVTTDSNHAGPIFPNLAKDLAPTGPNQLWVSDITYIALPDRFVYVAIVLDAWSRRIVGYAIGRSIDARLTVAALRSAIARRKPPPGLIHHSDRGSQYAADTYRQTLRQNGLIGSMGRKGNPYDNAKVESFMKTLKLEAVYPMAFETFIDVADHIPNFIEEVYNRTRLHSALGYVSPQQFEQQHHRQMGKSAA
jgi:putative transposase